MSAKGAYLIPDVAIAQSPVSSCCLSELEYVSLVNGAFDYTLFWLRFILT